MTLLSDLIATSNAVAATRARTAKTAALANLLRAIDRSDIETVVAALTGEPRQGRIGVGWATARITGTAAEPTVTVAELDETLTELGATTGTGSQAARRTLLADLAARLTPDEGDFVSRLLLGELRQGALAGVMTDAIALAADVPRPTIRRAAMLTGDLAVTARLALDGGADALEAVKLTVGTPVLPMLASPATTVAEAIAAQSGSAVEWKLDGARLQAHVGQRPDDGDDAPVRLYTRNLNDVTERLPHLVASLRALPIRSAILDGEVLGVDDTGLPQAFQDSMSSFGRSTQPASQMAVAWFDVLHLDGVDLLDSPLSDRLEALDSIDGIPRLPSIRTDDPDVAADVLTEALGAGHEGVVVKALDSPYAAGRRGASWRKIKPVHTLDLVVLAVEWGSGRRQGWLSNLHLGALDTDGNPVMVGKTFKGLTDALLTRQTERFLAIETHRDGHIVFVRPEVIVEIALDGAQVSRRYPGGVALRFARVRRYREDKTAAEADSLEVVRSLLPRSHRA